MPADFERHLNLKQEFARLSSTKPCGMPQAFARVGLTLAGTHRRGIDDARNIARLATLVLPRGYGTHPPRRGASPGRSSLTTRRDRARVRRPSKDRGKKPAAGDRQGSVR